MKIAILHEMLVKLWWAEKVVESFMQTFPEADIFTLIYDEDKVKEIFPKNKINKQCFSLATNKRYNLLKKQRLCLPLMAKSVESLDFSEYDVVLCSSSWFAHWAITKPETKFIVYYHSPAWYLWHQNHEYKNMILNNKNFIFRFLLNTYLSRFFIRAREWDFLAGQRTDVIIAASCDTKKRIEKYYNKKVDLVLFPPVDVVKFYNNSYKIKDYYLTISALTESKRLETMINAFNKMPNKKLKIIWVWNLEEPLKKLVKWDNIEFLWYKSWKELYKLVWESRWWIYTWVEDFWIAAIESMASGRPVFWLKEWWFKETIIPNKTWDFFDFGDGSDFISKFEIFEKNIDNWIYKEKYLLGHVKQFSKENFIEQIKNIVKK